MNPRSGVMLLVDADNVSADVVEQAFAAVMAAHGAIHVRRAYCTAESALKNLPLLKRLSIRPIVNLSTGKNSTDIALAVDAIDLAVAERPAAVVIVSSDSDFAPLVTRLREKGCRVEGIGQEGKTGEETIAVYDAFTVLAHRKPRAAAKAADRAPRPAAKRAARGQAASVDLPLDLPLDLPVAEPSSPPAEPRRRRERRPAAPARAGVALPKDVQAIIDAVPQLRGGGWVELGLAAEPLRKAKLLGKAAASNKLFKKHAAHFALQSEKQPYQVRFVGGEGG